MPLVRVLDQSRKLPIAHIILQALVKRCLSVWFLVSEYVGAFLSNPLDHASSSILLLPYLQVLLAQRCNEVVKVEAWVMMFAVPIDVHGLRTLKQ